MKYISSFSVLAFGLLFSCSGNHEVQTMGSIDRTDPALDSLISEDAVIEVVASGFKWAEGPLWLPDEQVVIFSDVPNNKIFQWSEKDGLKDYLSPSGFTGTATTSPEPGSNGLTLSNQGNLVLCQQGNRRIGMMDAPLNDPAPAFKSLADNYGGKKFNSPNDACVDNAGNIYFTDPPFGLAKQDEDSTKEAKINGVYLIKPDGTVKLLIDTLTRPNGIALTPDQKSLYVANCDPKDARWYKYSISGDSLTNGHLFYDVMDQVNKAPGLPDGMKVDADGNVFATGPGGVYILSPDGKLLGRINTPNATANVAFADDGKTLFMTSSSYLLRLKMQ